MEQQQFEMPWGFKVPPKDEEKDERADFGNAIAQLLVDKYKNIDEALEAFDEFDGHLECHVRNIYELDNEIPLKLLHHMTSNKWDDFDFDSEEHFNWAVKEVRKACEDYYGLNDPSPMDAVDDIEEFGRQCFYDGREIDRVDEHGRPIFKRPTFNGYLRELKDKLK